MSPPPRLPTVRTLRPGLHLLETEVEAFDVRSAVLVGTSRAVVWDTLAHPLQMRPAEELVGDLPVTVVYSHADWDHVWGTAGLGQWDPQAGAASAGGGGHTTGAAGWEAVVAHEGTAARFRTDVPAELAERRRAGADPGNEVRLVPPTLTFTGETTLDLGGATLRLHELPGHTADCVVGLVPEWGVLLAGDTVETPLPVVNDGAAVPAWIEALEGWLAHPSVRSVVPSHGRVGGLELVRETADYLRALLAGRRAAPGGETLRPPGDGPSPALSPFYRKTHEANVRRVAEARSGQEGP